MRRFRDGVGVLRGWMLEVWRHILEMLRRSRRNNYTKERQREAEREEEGKQRKREKERERECTRESSDRGRPVLFDILTWEAYFLGVMRSYSFGRVGRM